MRICLLGPTHPYRGGIAHYTTILARALGRRHTTKFISYTRQYPQWLFPGKTDKEPGEPPLPANHVEYLLDSMNPLTWRRTARAIVAFRPDLFVLPWWVAYWMPQYAYIIGFVKRRSPARVVIECHNVVEHEASRLKVAASRRVLAKADRLITHSREETARLRELLGDGADIATAFHPTYVDLKTRQYAKDEAKERLGLNGDVLLFFGFVRAYKGLGVLLDAMPRILAERPVTLLVVGEFWNDKQAYLDQIEKHDMASSVRVIDKYVTSEEMAVYFCAADLVVQPYVSATGSGVVQLAYGFDRPVVATRVGSLSEIVEDGVNGRLAPPGDPAALARAVAESLDTPTLEEYTRRAAKTKERFSWEELVRIITSDGVTDAGDGDR